MDDLQTKRAKLQAQAKHALLTQLTVSVPEAGRAYGNYGPNKSYKAARERHIPGVIRCGSSIRVSTAPLRRKLQLEESTDA